MPKICRLLPAGLLLLLAGCSNPLVIVSQLNHGALKVQTNIKAKVLVNNTLIGTTPITNKSFTKGDYTITLQAEGISYTNSVHIEPSAVTMIDRKFMPPNTDTSGAIAQMEKGKGVTIITTPANTKVLIDKNDRGTSPVAINDLAEGNHEITLSAPGYQSRTLTIKINKGFSLQLTVDLAREGESDYTPTPSTKAPTAEIPGTISLTTPTTIPNPKILPKPTITPRPTPTPRPTEVPLAAGQARIGFTPTGWLRVRDSGSLAGKEIGKLNVGTIVTVSEETSGWTHITSPDGTNGWVSSQYLKK